MCGKFNGSGSRGCVILGLCKRKVFFSNVIRTRVVTITHFRLTFDNRYKCIKILFSKKVINSGIVTGYSLFVFGQK